jgi:hypothetical protein
MWNLVNNEVVADIFYPFGEFDQDIKAPNVEDQNFGPIRFNYITNFKYFNKEYSSLYINPNGLISFDSSYFGNDGSKYNYPNDIFTALAPYKLINTIFSLNNLS